MRLYNFTRSFLFVSFSLFFSDPGLENKSVSSCDGLNDLFHFQGNNDGIRNAISRYAQMQPPMKKSTETRERYARLGSLGVLG